MINLNRIMYYVLIVGMLSSTALFVLGLGVFVVENPSPSASLPQFSPGKFLEDLSTLKPVGILTLATIVLIATPITRVFVSVLVFAKNGEKRFVLVTGVVFAILMLSLVVGYAFHFSFSG
jgi:uncharacterized membrane protein